MGSLGTRARCERFLLASVVSVEFYVRLAPTVVVISSLEVCRVIYNVINTLSAPCVPWRRELCCHSCSVAKFSNGSDSNAGRLARMPSLEKKDHGQDNRVIKINKTRLRTNRKP